ncbi:hypothetical protein KGR20_21110 [Cytobacillus oceanisediminis]|uniref:hypothetical protein n=1 Tax=Cytobacillus oceanisediminis TaxID=665099 RepID=UPI001CD011E5|nr:hypothetical protein [Cytobacillus oceanisediminis]MBZ9536666.1 hypothetical protein [Cytobacillus oceanisediminis]
MATKKKWAGVQLTDKNVDEYLYDLSNGKARHITQGVSFNKEDPTQMNLLRLALIRHGSFSGLVKFMLAEIFKEANVDWEVHPVKKYKQHVKEEPLEELIPISDKKGLREIIANLILPPDKKIK